MAAKKRKKKAAKKTSASKKAVRKTGRKKASKRAGGRPPKGTPTKADFIRAGLAKGMSAADIVAAGAAEGIKIHAPQVYKLKGKGTSKSGAKASSARGRKNGKLTASDFIRQHPDKPAGEIVKLGAAQGLKFSASAVYQTRNYDKRRGGASQGRPGRKPKAAPAWKPQVLAGGGRGDEATFKKMALDIGLERARQLLDDLVRGLARLIEG